MRSSLPWRAPVFGPNIGVRASLWRQVLLALNLIWGCGPPVGGRSFAGYGQRSTGHWDRPFGARPLRGWP
ncbi:MAG: hypothetical protein AAFY65_17495, partial [Pseudomonadota bacterium]